MDVDHLKNEPLKNSSVVCVLGVVCAFLLSFLLDLLLWSNNSHCSKGFTHYLTGRGRMIYRRKRGEGKKKGRGRNG